MGMGLSEHVRLQTRLAEIEKRLAALEQSREPNQPKESSESEKPKKRG